MINLLDIQPSTVSRDLTGYITYIYGAPKIGKTTFARDGGALILAAEVGTNALSGAFVQPILTWSDIKTVAIQLKQPALKDKFKAIAVDTVDALAPLLEKYICQKNSVETLGEVAWGSGWSQYKKEWEQTFREIAKEGYAIIFISHAQDKTVSTINGQEFNKTGATMSKSINEIIKGMSDIIGYAYQDPDTHERRLMLRSLEGDVDVGCRFQYIDPIIDFSYKSLQDALSRAIDEEANHNGAEAVTKERKVISFEPELDYDALVKEFKSITGKIMKNPNNAPKITKVCETHLGKGKKVRDTNPSQAELIKAINEELKLTLLK